MNNKNTSIPLFDNLEMIEDAVEKLHGNSYMIDYLLEENVPSLGDKLKKYCAIGIVLASAWGLLYGATLLFLL